MTAPTRGILTVARCGISQYVARFYISAKSHMSNSPGKSCRLFIIYLCLYVLIFTDRGSTCSARWCTLHSLFIIQACYWPLYSMYSASRNRHSLVFLVSVLRIWVLGNFVFCIFSQQTCFSSFFYSFFLFLSLFFFSIVQLGPFLLFVPSKLPAIYQANCAGQ